MCIHKCLHACDGGQQAAVRELHTLRAGGDKQLPGQGRQGGGGCWAVAVGVQSGRASGRRWAASGWVVGMTCKGGR